MHECNYVKMDLRKVLQNRMNRTRESGTIINEIGMTSVTQASNEKTEGAQRRAGEIINEVKNGRKKGTQMHMYDRRDVARSIRWLAAWLAGIVNER